MELVINIITAVLCSAGGKDGDYYYTFL